MLRLYDESLAVKKAAIRTVKELLVQLPGRITNAAGEHPFNAPWPAGTVVSAKTGRGTDRSGTQVRWLVGHISRGPRSWIFVSCVTGSSDVPALAAVEQAERALREERALP